MTTTGAGELVIQTAGETRFVVDCRVNPVALVGHVKMTFAPEGNMVSVAAAGALTDPNERLNIVPLPEPPPLYAVPYSELPDETNPACGLAPSPFVGLKLSTHVKLCRIVKVCAVTRPAGSKLSTAISAGTTNRYLMFGFMDLILLLTGPAGKTAGRR